MRDEHVPGAACDGRDKGCDHTNDLDRPGDVPKQPQSKDTRPEAEEHIDQPKERREHKTARQAKINGLAEYERVRGALDHEDREENGGGHQPIIGIGRVAREAIIDLEFTESADAAALGQSLAFQSGAVGQLRLGGRSAGLRHRQRHVEGPWQPGANLFLRIVQLIGEELPKQVCSSLNLCHDLALGFVEVHILLVWPISVASERACRTRLRPSARR